MPWFNNLNYNNFNSPQKINRSWFTKNHSRFTKNHSWFKVRTIPGFCQRLSWVRGVPTPLIIGYILRKYVPLPLTAHFKMLPTTQKAAIKFSEYGRIPLTAHLFRCTLVLRTYLYMYIGTRLYISGTSNHESLSPVFPQPGCAVPIDWKTLW